MVKLTIDGKEVLVPEGSTILEAATQAGIQIPTLCYLKDINEIGACRVCVVEVKGNDKLVASCNNVVREGMEVTTNSHRVREARKTNVELMLSRHDCQCPTCVRSGNCGLQALSNELGLFRQPYEKRVPKMKIKKNFPLIRDQAKCIECMRCVQVCDKVQGMNVWDVSGTGSRTVIDVSHNREIEDSDCTLCGQCITHCPVGALREYDETDAVFDAIDDPKKITVVQIAPAVRAAWGEPFGLKREDATVKRLVSALRQLGFDYIFDTNFAADLTIMEEGNELLKRLQEGDLDRYFMFTSCCPGWVRFLKGQYPELTDRLSTAKSPQQMFGAMAKTYYAQILGVPADQIYTVSVMPCLAKKREASLPTMNDSGAEHDVDVVLTTREIDRMLRAAQVKVLQLEEEEFDAPLGVGTGAAVIFGTTGGVMEAALRSGYYLAMGENPPVDAFCAVRGTKPWREATFQLGEAKLRVAVVSGLANTRKLVEEVKKGRVHYHFVEVMACPGGCGGGGGQPIWEGEELGAVRGKLLYQLDEQSALRFSHENPAVLAAYESYLEAPLSHRAHQLLHTDHHGWEMPKAVRVEE